MDVYKEMVIESLITALHDANNSYDLGRLLVVVDDALIRLDIDRENLLESLKKG